MNPIDRIVSEIEAEFAPNQNGELLRDSAAAARMRILEEERNAAVLEAERARKERDCAMAREKVAVALREERDRLKGAYMAELRNARKAAEEEREAHARTTEAYRQLVAFFECVCLTLNFEKDSHAVTRAMLKLTSEALEALRGKQ